MSEIINNLPARGEMQCNGDIIDGVHMIKIICGYRECVLNQERGILITAFAKKDFCAGPISFPLLLVDGPKFLNSG